MTALTLFIGKISMEENLMIKTKWYAPVIIMVALTLIAGIGLLSSDVSAAATNAKVKLVATNGTTESAKWSILTTPPAGYGVYTALLNGGTQDGNTYAAVVIPMNGTVLLSSITSFKYNFYATSAQGYPHVCFYTHDPVDAQTGEVTMYSGGSPLTGQTTGWNEVVVTPESPLATGSSGFFWYGSESTSGLTQGLPNTYTLAQFQGDAATAFSRHVIDRIQIEYGWWASPPAPGTTGDCWVDKVQLNAGTIFDYNLEPIALDKAFYKAGETVYITVQNANKSGTVAVTAQSDLPDGPRTIACSETGTGTGIFTGSFKLVSTTPGTGELLVSNDNTITVIYAGDWGDGTDTTTTTAIYHDVAPTVALSTTAANPTNASPIACNATFSENVTGFELGDIIVTNGTANTLLNPVPTKTYTFNVIPSGDGLVTVNIPAGVCLDRAGNPNTAATPLTRTSDRTAPTVILSAAAQDPTNAAFIVVTATFSEVVTGFAQDNITVSNGSKNNFTNVGGAGTIFTDNVTPGGDGLVTVAIAGSMCTDLAGNANTASNVLTRISDRTPPTVVLFSPLGASGVLNTDVTPVPFTATFSENVTGFIVSDITVTPTTATAGSFVIVSPSVYTFSVTPTASGGVTVCIPAASAQDLATNPNTGPICFTFTFVNNRPTTTISSSVGATGSVTKTSPIPFTVTFSAAVTGFVVGDITVANGAASGFTGVGTTYAFNVTPTGQGAVTVNIAAGVCIDASSRPNLAATAFSIVYDTVAPSVIITCNSTWVYTFTWSENITGFGAGCITVTGGTGAGATVPATAIPPNKVFTLAVTPTACDGTVPTVVTVLAACVTDTAGNTNAARTDTRTCAGTDAIYLGTGWNLISYPLVPANTDIATILAGVSANIDPTKGVWNYDTAITDPTLRWKTWTPAMPAGPNRLDTIEDGKAYWIGMSAPATLVVTGTLQPLPPAGPREYPLAVGWNMVGYKSATFPVTGRTTTVYLGSGETYVQMMYKFDNANNVFVPVPKGTMWNPGEGFWIATTTAFTIYP
jgi:hypothetical protein